MIQKTRGPLEPLKLDMWARELCFTVNVLILQACSVSSAAIVSSLHLTRNSFDVVKRWTNEVQESCSSDNIMVQVISSSALIACFIENLGGIYF